MHLLDDEKKVLETAADAVLLDNRTGTDAKLFLDVLLEKSLVTVLETKVGERQGSGRQDVTGTYADVAKAAKDEADFLKINTFALSFALR